MKKTLKFIGLFAMAAVLFSCEKKVDPTVDTPKDPEQQGVDLSKYNPDEYLVSFGATIEAPQTKATITIGDSDANVKFDNNDKVRVVSGTNSATYVYNKDGNQFTPEGEPLKYSTDEILFYYPADNFNTSGVFTMPDAAADLADLGDKAPMAAKSAAGETVNVTFKNVASILQVGITGNRTLEKVQLSADEFIGDGTTFAVSWSGDTPSMASGEGSAKSVTVERSEPLSDNPAIFYFIVPAGIDLTGVNVTAFLTTKDNGSMEMFTIDRGNWNATPGNIYKMSFYAGLFSGGTGTSEDPYIIANARDFKHISKYSAPRGNNGGYGSLEPSHFLGAYYKQTADIDINNSTLIPIGSGDTPFTGVYDGNSKKLENVSISTTTDDTGLFAYLDGATVKDLTVSGTIQSTGINVGSLAGRSDGASISRYFNEANVTGGQYVGGIVGNMEDGKIYACVNSADVTSRNTEAGGIVGRFQGGTIRACYTSAGILVSGYSRIGGIAGYQSNQGKGASLIINCAAKSNIRSTNSGNNGAAGGLVGYMYSAADKGDVVLTNCVALGSGIYNTWKKDAYLGAIVGEVNGAEALCYVRNCYSQHNSTTNIGAAVYYSSKSDGSTITNTKQTYMGGIYGYLLKGTVQNCYCVGSKSAGISSDALVGAGTKDSGAAAGNTRMIVNNVKNGTQAVNVSTWTFYPSGIKDSSATSAYLVDIMNLGTWKTTINGARFSYVSSEGTEESVCEWVGQNGSDHSAYNPAFPSEILDLNVAL